MCFDYGVPDEWGVQAGSGLVPPSRDDARAAARWCSGRSASGRWRLCLPASIPAPEAWTVHETVEVLPMYAAPADALLGRDAPLADGVTLDADPAGAEVLAAYGAWMDDPGLARLLVRPGDLARGGRRFLVARLHGEPVGCAFVWWAGGTGYLSGIGVRSDARRQGIGRALTVAAAAMAAAGPDGPGAARPDVVWMHATMDGAALYRTLGFAHVDDLLHVHATPA